MKRVLSASGWSMEVPEEKGSPKVSDNAKELRSIINAARLRIRKSNGIPGNDLPVYQGTRLVGYTPVPSEQESDTEMAIRN